MAASGKKSKKAKWIKANLTDILAEPTTIATTNNWAASVDEETESYGYGSRTRAPVVLPSASRAARGGLAVDDESIPRRPPYIAHISNLPYDVDESAINELFEGLKITNLRLPREGDRLKGFGYVDFEDRESLVSAMNIADLTISGRRIRIEVATQDNDRRMGRGGMGRSDRDREYDPERTMGDWRSGPRAAPDPQARAPRTMDREERRDRPPDRERESSADNRPGGWRDGDRPAAPPEREPARTPYGGRDSFGRDRFEGERGRETRGYGGRDGFRTAERDGGGYGSREGRGFGGRSFGDRDRDRDPPREDTKPRERPKLNLLPRTVPRESEVPTKPADGAPLEKEEKISDKPKPVPAENIFGAAKPVDTAAKEREIEERLRKQEEEARRAGEEKERWGSRRNDHSDDRRAGGRREDRPRDSRSYNRDRRDYSKDDKDRRNDRDRRDSNDGRDRRDSNDGRDRRDSNDGRDRRDSKDGRDRRDSKDGRDRRDSRDRRNSKDDRERRDYSKDDKDRRDIKDDKDRRDGSYRGEDRGRREDRPDNSAERRRDHSREYSRERADSRDRRRSDSREREGPLEPNGADRPSRSRDRRDDEDKPLPKLKEQEKPNFVASNKFSFLEDADDAGSD